MRILSAIAVLLLCTLGRADEGVLPLGDDGKPLNLDFETGTLKDWTATGEAFKGQPIEGDTVAKRRGDMKSGHQGKFWVGGYEKLLDKPLGELASVDFKVTHPWASYLLGGGDGANTRVELVLKGTGQVVHKTSGRNAEEMQRVAVDLRPYRDQRVFIRIIDKASGGWGHVNFDDFRFHAEQPKAPLAAEKKLPSDIYKYAGLKPEESAKAMTVPKGFDVKLFAGEPDVKQPIAFCLDDRGRLWVAEAYSYPIRQPEGKGLDRIVIFEDTDGDGKFDKRTVFMEGLNLVSGIAYGFGGIYVGAAPQLLFIPIKEGEDKPAGPPQVLLDGWGYEDTHETLNCFTWGPDGWLYGCHGVFTHSKVGKPGTTANERIPINAGIWRYHPTKHVFEVFSHGTSNPWGMDFDAFGNLFIEACVIPHNWYMIQGGRYHRQGGTHFNPYTYDDIQTIALHRHYVGNQWNNNDRAGSDSFGGGHAHCGAMIYQGGAWPKEYNGKMFMGNLHGHRLNIDTLTPKGSGFVADRHPDFLLSNDLFAMFINMLPGPDGNVYMLDWYDRQTCHTRTPEIWDRTNGRIYKISYEGTKPVKVDLSKRSDTDLAELQFHDNIWYVRHARRLLQERAATRKIDPLAIELLEGMLKGFGPDTDRVRAAWALHVIGGTNLARAREIIKDRTPQVAAWGVKLGAETSPTGQEWTDTLLTLAKSTSSPVVRLAIASALQRLPVAERTDILEVLASKAEDANDHNLPLMVWYALEPLAEVNANRALEIARTSPLPNLFSFMVRRTVALGTPEALDSLVKAAGDSTKPTEQQVLVQGISDALKGRRDVGKPKSWDAALVNLQKGDAGLALMSKLLAVRFGDAELGKTLLRDVFLKSSEPEAKRLAVLSVLQEMKAPELPAACRLVLGVDKAMRGPALRALGAFDDDATPTAIFTSWAGFDANEKRDALGALVSRPKYALALLEQIEKKLIDGKDVPADLIRQLRGLNDKALNERVEKVWGVVRDTPADRKRAIAAMRVMLQKPNSLPPDHAMGRAIFAKTCQQCHTLYSVGGKIGPDITGANRGNLDYLLENILDPSAVIPKEYAVTDIQLKSGRKVSGIVKEESAQIVAVQTANELLTIPVGDIEERRGSMVSMMPEDQLKPMSEHEIRSLIAYLQSPTQTRIQATADNTKDFFNGKDLTGWDGEPNLWRVENGEIIGSTEGLKKNTFLKSQMEASDFKLSLKMKLTPNKENSGIQFRSEPLPDGEMRGPQADAGAGWWGKLYEESGRGLLWKESGEKHLKPDDWNDYVIEAKGGKIQTWINGNLCVDLEDDKISNKGIFGLQMHSGGKLEVRFKDLKLEVK